jgi:V8-like Glu-specific endopeptidase
MIDMIDDISLDHGQRSSVINWNDFNSSLLIEVFRNKSVFTSSAVLIRRNVILTAAHSVFGIDKGYVHLGHEYSKENIRIAFKKVIIHKGYNKQDSNFKNDIALIILENNLPRSIKPVPLATAMNLSGANVDRLGFGARSGKNKRTWTNPNILDVKDNYLELNDKKSVVGDSGGPLYYQNKLVGIHSTKEGQKAFAVYVPQYIKWIEDHLPLKKI